MGLPRVDEHHRLPRQRLQPAAHGEKRVWTTDLYKGMTVMVRMSNKRLIHVEQRDTAEPSLEYFYSA